MQVEIEKIYVLRDDIPESEKEHILVGYPFMRVAKFLRPHMRWGFNYLCHGSADGGPFILLGNHIPPDVFERFYVPYEEPSKSRLDGIK